MSGRELMTAKQVVARPMSAPTDGFVPNSVVFVALISGKSAPSHWER